MGTHSMVLRGELLESHHRVQLGGADAAAMAWRPACAGPALRRLGMRRTQGQEVAHEGDTIGDGYVIKRWRLRTVPV